MYKAIESGNILIHYNIDEDGPRGTKGLITGETLDRSILFSDELKDSVELRLKAYCFDHPHGTAYLCNDGNRILETFRNEALETAERKYGDLVLFLRAFALVLILNTVAASIFGYFRVGHRTLWLLAAMAIPCLYNIVIVKTRIQNNMEATLASIILSALIWVILGYLLRYV